MDREGTVKLYEVVDLSSIGIKNKTIKEIDECQKTLTDRCIAMGIDIVSSNDLRARSTAIATGYLHNRYTYDDEIKKFSNISHGQYGDRFKQWDVSMVEPKHKAHYLGIPFIIRSTDDRGDLYLITQIISIDNRSITDAIHSNSRYASEEFVIQRNHIWHWVHSGSVFSQKSNDGITEVWDHSIASWVQWIQTNLLASKKSTQIARVLGGHIVLPYEASMYDYQITRHESSQDAQEFYLKYCLIPLLFEHNASIRKYFQWKDQEWVEFFAELLKRFLSEHDMYRINPDNIPKTETSFKHDTGIIMRFQESSDPIIRDFRLNGVPKKITRILPNISGESDSTIDTKQSNRVIELKNTYAKLLGESRQSTRVIPLDVIEKMILDSLISLSSEWKGETSNISSFVQISEIMNTIEKLNDSEIRDLSSLVKWIWAKQNEYHKYELIQLRLQKFAEIFNEKRIWWDNKQELLQAMNSGFFGDMSKENKLAYQLFVERITSGDPKKRKRAINNENTGLKYYQSLFEIYRSSIESRVKILSERVNLSANKEAKDILDNLLIFVKGIYNKDYLDAVIVPKLYNIMRTLLRDSITEKKWLRILLSEWLAQKGMGQHIQWFYTIFEELVTHDDLQYELDEYREWGAIYAALLRSNSPQELTIFIENLEKLLLKLRKSVQKVDSNSLWQDYCKNRYN
jgi:hypothetical protein